MPWPSRLKDRGQFPHRREKAVFLLADKWYNNSRRVLIDEKTITDRWQQPAAPCVLCASFACLLYTSMSGSKIKFRAEISPWAYENVAYIRNVLEGSIDIVIKEFRLGNGQKAASFYINGLINNDMMGRDFFEPLFQADKEKIYTADDIVKNVLKAGNISVQDNMSTLIDNVLQGLTALFLDGSTTAVMMEAISWPQRSVNEPSTDVVIRGPREGFIENMRNNVTLLRRKIHHPDFHVETVRLGRYTRTDIALVYVSSIVNKDVLVKLRKRLQSIDIDAVLDSGYIEQFIQDTPYSIFPTIGIAEKPDIAAVSYTHLMCIRDRVSRERQLRTSASSILRQYW